MTFEQLGLSAPLLRGLADAGHETPTPIQTESIPHVLQGRDVLAIAQTGSGKTAAFALPILQRLDKPGGRIRCLVLTPTRELAAQVAERFSAYGRHLRLKHAVIFGGVGQQPQVDALRRGVDVLVATPGRLVDLMGQRLVSLDAVEVLVLDESDRMLDLGFAREVMRIIDALPRRRQNLLFSATLMPEVKSLIDRLLVNPVKVEVTPASTAVERVDQKVYFVDRPRKKDLLVHLLADAGITRAVVFTRTKNGANRLGRHLEGARIAAEVIHGNKSQNARERALGAFKTGTTRVLIATDVAARGIDVDRVSHVINFDLPNVPETYVHRIGRTARAGQSGVAISLCDAEERAYLRSIEKTIRLTLPVCDDHPFPAGRAHASAHPPEPREAHARNGGPRGPAQKTAPRRDAHGHDGQRRNAPQAKRRHGRPGSAAPRPAASSASSPSNPRRPPMPKWY